MRLQQLILNPSQSLKLTIGWSRRKMERGITEGKLSKVPLDLQSLDRHRSVHRHHQHHYRNPQSHLTPRQFLRISIQVIVMGH